MPSSLVPKKKNARNPNAVTKHVVSILPGPELLNRQEMIQKRLEELRIDGDDDHIADEGDDATMSVRKGSRKRKGPTQSPASSSPSSFNPSPPPPIPRPPPHPDVHWDYLLKEMLWLSTDFASERKRQLSMARRLSNSAVRYVRDSERRRHKLLRDEEARLRRHAAKMSRNVVRGWWSGRVDRVIAYAQRMEAEDCRKRAMDRRLIHLVKQTERYANKLEPVADGNGKEEGDSNGKHVVNEKKRSGGGWGNLDKIEQALKSANTDSFLHSFSKTETRTKTKALVARGSEPMTEIESMATNKALVDESSGVNCSNCSNNSTNSGGVVTTKRRKQRRKKIDYLRLSEEIEQGAPFTTFMKGGDTSKDSYLTNSGDQQSKEALEIYNGNNDVGIRTFALKVEDGAGNVDEKGCPFISDDVKAMDDVCKTRNTIGAMESLMSVSSTENNKKNNLLEEEDDEFLPNENVGSKKNADFDDETTLQAEEMLEKELSYKEEMEMLKRESEIPIEELRKGYKKMLQQDVDNIEDQRQDKVELLKENKDEGQCQYFEEKDKQSMMIKKVDTHISGQGQYFEQKDKKSMITNELKTNVSSSSITQNVITYDGKNYSEDNKGQDKNNKKGDEDDKLKLDKDAIDINTLFETGDNICRETIQKENEHQKEIQRNVFTEIVNHKAIDHEQQHNTYLPSENTNILLEDNDKQQQLYPEESNDQSITLKNTTSLSSSSFTPIVVELQGANSNEIIKVEEEQGFQPKVKELGEEMDDRFNCEAEEKMFREFAFKEELAILKNEKVIPIDELNKMYTKMLNNDFDINELHSDGGEQLYESHKRKWWHPDDCMSQSIEINDTQFTIALEKDAMVEEENNISRQKGDTMSDKVNVETTFKPLDEKLKNEVADNENNENVYEQQRSYVGKNKDGSILLKGDPVCSSLLTQLVTCEDDVPINVNDRNEEEDEEFQLKPSCVENEIDDETTLIAEENFEIETSHKEEMALLKIDNEIPIEELRKMYSGFGKTANDHNITSRPERRLLKSKGNILSVDQKVTSLNSLHDRPLKKPKIVSGDLTDKDEGTKSLQLLEVSDSKSQLLSMSRPFLLSWGVKLREYQQIGLNWLVSIQTKRLNGILADEMGLGKTLQTISLLAYLACYKGIWGPHLIVVPTSCIVNWEVELKRFCPAFKVLCYYGSAKRRKELRQGWTKANWHHVIITSYQLVVQDSFAFKRKKWYYLILDEAQNIKNFQSQRWQTLVNFNTQRRLLLTGTPLQNNLMELWSLLNFLMPHVFQSRKEFSYWFSNPLNSIIEGNTTRNNNLIGRLHGIIRPFILRRLKKDVETQMPGKFEHVVKCQLSRRQMFLYEEFMARSSTRVALGTGANYIGMMNVLMQLRKVCNHPDLFEPRSVITPFFTDPLSMSVPSCVADALKSSSIFSTVSNCLIHSLWSAGCSIPSFNETMNHDENRAIKLQALKTPEKFFLEQMNGDNSGEPRQAKDGIDGLNRFLNSIWNTSTLEKKRVSYRQANINYLRCQSEAFILSQKTINSVTIDHHFSNNSTTERGGRLKIASTPKELLMMRKSHKERADDLDGIIKKFVFCVPKTSARPPILVANKADTTYLCNQHSHAALDMIKDHFDPFQSVNARLTSFFPDKKLVQFDAGKLQTLAELLRTLKRGNHRALIFTQMSKMLNILELFLNLNGHTYLRLDGSTSVDERQHLMDRFNNDQRIFCFILSTRSGGLGINLTGADTVVFYDSDWNPAMDAQAQDRAHRIGQTRDVHIYRLVTTHTIEENILLKARQKRNLDFLVMNEGKFHATQSSNVGHNDKKDDKLMASKEDEHNVFSKGGLRNIIGIQNEDETGMDICETKTKNVDVEFETKEQIESTMLLLEDEDDVKAMRGAQKEAIEELKEFDESTPLKKEDDDKKDELQGRNGKINTDNLNESLIKQQTSKSISQSNEEKTDELLEKEFAAWQSKVGVDKDLIDASLTPIERYALKFREEIDPFYSDWFLSEQEQTMESLSIEQEWDMEAIEFAKAEEEQQAMEDGDLLVTFPQPKILPSQHQCYIQEKVKLSADKKRRKLTGENWVTRTDFKTKLPFWYNSDTGEAIWDKPNVLIELEADKAAHDKKWNALPKNPLLQIMRFLAPFPGRMKCALVCRQWKDAAQDISFVKHVYPVEMAAIAEKDPKINTNNFKNLLDALSLALPGDTIELGDGHYWVNDNMVDINFPLKIIGDENHPSRVVIELNGKIIWKGKGGWIEGVTIRRPKINVGVVEKREICQINSGSRVSMVHCIMDNEGFSGNVLRVHGHGDCNSINVRGSGESDSGVLIEKEGSLQMTRCEISNNQGNGIQCESESSLNLKECEIKHNKRTGIVLKEKSTASFFQCEISNNGGNGILYESESSFKERDCEIKHNNKIGVVLKDNCTSSSIQCEISKTKPSI